MDVGKDLKKRRREWKTPLEMSTTGLRSEAEDGEELGDNDALD